MKYADFAGGLGRRIGSYFAVEIARRERLADALDNPTPAPLPAGWGTSPRRAPKAKANPQVAALKVPAKAYRPTHGGYPG